MWIPNKMVDQVNEVAIIFYVDWQRAKVWNDNRRPAEPRLMTGWVWASKTSNAERAGFKSVTAAYIDAWYRLVMDASPPRINQRRKK